MIWGLEYKQIWDIFIISTTVVKIKLEVRTFDIDQSTYVIGDIQQR